MKLIRARVQNYRSVEDSEEFEIGQLTCLVGKNEAGKTALLSALRGLDPLQPFDYDRTRDYPRRFAAKYDERHPDGEAEVVRTWWQVEPADRAVVEEAFGTDVLKSDIIEIYHGFGFENCHWTIAVDEAKALAHKYSAHQLSAPERNILTGITTSQNAIEALKAAQQRSAKQDALLKELQAHRQGRITLAVIDLLHKRKPRFFFTSHFVRMSGEIAVNKLKADIKQNKVEESDQIFLDFLTYAGTDIDELSDASRREELNALCEAASNDITDEIFQFWSQNSALEVVITFSAAKPGDNAPFNEGTIAEIRIRNTNHKATLPLSERSAGFVWFFSFLAQFKQLKKVAGNAIILLDEPGLTLHGKAQGDLLRYVVQRLLPEHQVIYTTHSPFMVPSDRLADVRIVEDVIERDGGRVVVKGTKVRSDVLSVSDDTLFPLQGALGYEVTQTLFVGPNSLLVEGVSDIVYLETISQALAKRKREGLRREWTLCPSGGIDKIAPFVRLFGGNKLNVAVLSDLAKGDLGKVEKLRKADILKAGQFYTIADFLGQAEADVEDLIAPALFARLLNSTYGLTGANEVTVDKLNAADPTVRMVKKAEALFRVMPPGTPEFGHYGPAEWLMRNPAFLDGDNAEIVETLDRFEKVFKTYNSMLSKA